MDRGSRMVGPFWVPNIDDSDTMERNVVTNAPGLKYKIASHFTQFEYIDAYFHLVDLCRMQYLLHARLIKAVSVKIELIPGFKARHLKYSEEKKKLKLMVVHSHVEDLVIKNLIFLLKMKKQNLI